MAGQELTKKRKEQARRRGLFAQEVVPGVGSLGAAASNEMEIYSDRDDAILEVVSDDSIQNSAVPSKLFEEAIDRLGHVAQEMSSLALSTAIAVAQIKAEGDRIDRLIAENQKMLDDLLAGNW